MRVPSLFSIAMSIARFCRPLSSTPAASIAGKKNHAAVISSPSAVWPKLASLNETEKIVSITTGKRKVKNTVSPWRKYARTS